MTQAAHDELVDAFQQAKTAVSVLHYGDTITALRKAAAIFEDHGFEDASQEVFDVIRDAKKEDPNIRMSVMMLRGSSAVKEGLEKVHRTSEEDDPATKRAKDKEELAAGDKLYSDKQKEIRVLARFRKAKAARMQRAIEVGKRGGKYYTIAGGKKVYVKE